MEAFRLPSGLVDGLSRVPCPSIIPEPWRAATVLTAGALSLYAFYKFLFTSPGYNPPPPGSMYLAFQSRKRFNEVCNLIADPYVFDIHEEPFVKVMEDNWKVIRDELKAYLSDNDGALKPFGHTHRMSSKSCWRVLSIRLWGISDPMGEENFPKTMAILRKAFPGKEWQRLTGAIFSQLEPQSSIAPHYGDTNANYRCHLGLIVPGGLPDAGMEIGDESQAWKEGKVFAFNDAHHHRAWNNTDHRRFVLIFDVMRREHLKYRNHVCRFVMASFLLQRIANLCSIVKATKWMEYYSHSVLYYCLYFPVNFGIGSSFIHWFMRS
eukprot:gene9652-1866_t